MSHNKYIINKNALKFNAEKIKKVVGENVKLCGVVKANAYGHGGVIVANCLKNICDYFAVACLKEAKELRDSGITNPIIMLGILSKSDVKYCFLNKISINVSSLTQFTDILNELNSIKNTDGNTLKIHIKINTGLNRLGVSSVDEFLKIVSTINDNPLLKLEGIFTHFATKGNDVEFIFKQYSEFEKYINFVDKKCIIIHNSNSYASLNFSQFSNSMVRSGFALYGWQEGFEPVLKITSEIVQINNVQNGSVGYDRTYFAENKKIAVIPIGYADGFDRRLSNNFSVLVNDCFAPVVGNICMDMCMIDVTNIPDIKVGSVVTILGRDHKNEISVFDYANALGTSPYEILLKFKSDRMDIIEL